MTNSTYIE